MHMNPCLSNAPSRLTGDGPLGAPKLTDFGVAKALPENSAAGNPTAETGTYRWMPPEVIRHEHYASGVDVYSYAMLMYELITHHTPFAELSSIQAAVLVGLENKRPPLPEGTPPPLERLLARAWATDAAERPPSSDLVSEITTVEALLSPREVTWLDAPRGHPVVMAPALRVAPARMRPRSRWWWPFASR